MVVIVTVQINSVRAINALILKELLLLVLRFVCPLLARLNISFSVHDLTAAFTVTDHPDRH